MTIKMCKYKKSLNHIIYVTFPLLSAVPLGMALQAQHGRGSLLTALMPTCLAGFRSLCAGAIVKKMAKLRSFFDYYLPCWFAMPSGASPSASTAASTAPFIVLGLLSPAAPALLLVVLTDWSDVFLQLLQLLVGHRQVQRGGLLRAPGGSHLEAVFRETMSGGHAL